MSDETPITLALGDGVGRTVEVIDADIEVGPWIERGAHEAPFISSYADYHMPYQAIWEFNRTKGQGSETDDAGSLVFYYPENTTQTTASVWISAGDDFAVGLWRPRNGVWADRVVAYQSAATPEFEILERKYPEYDG